MKKLIAFIVRCFLSAGFRTYITGSNQPPRSGIWLPGHQSKYHVPEMPAGIFSKKYFKDAINTTYATRPDNLNGAVPVDYYALVLYANSTFVFSRQEKSLLNFAKRGKEYEGHSARNQVCQTVHFILT